MLGDWLRRRLEAKGWSPAQAATHLGVSENDVSSWLKGAMPETEKLCHLSEHLGDPYSPPGVGRVASSLNQGDPVEVRGTRWGVAKLRSINEEVATVTLFGGPGCIEERKAAADHVRPIVVTPQTRCYLYDEERDAWSVGRIKHYDEEADHYVVDLPSRQFATVSPEDLEIRSAEVERAPTEVLVERGHETTFFYRYRSALTRALTDQRALTRGLTGLVSSRIHLYEHQVEVVRRVLSDPVPRYILADEVGLGKTIEAGVVARQHLLDDPDACVAIVVPPHLRGQWQHEWDHKFALRTHDPRVHIVTSEALEDVPPATLLIVDEAHHLGQAFAHDEGKAWARYDVVRNLAHAAETVLLLTATPSALAPEGLLGLLHLVDPLAYDLDDRNAFYERLRLQEDLGRTLSALSPNDPAFLIEEGISELEELFPDDNILKDFIAEVRPVLDSAGGGSEELAGKLGKVRHHVKETYRLFQRLLRYRRRDVDDVLIDRSEGVLREEYGLDLRERDVLEALEAWRQAAVAAGVETQRYASLYVFLIELGGTDLNLLAEAVAFRGRNATPKHLTLTPEERALLQLPSFEGEEERLGYLYEVASAPIHEHDLSRVDLLVEAVSRSVKQERHVVVFTTRRDMVPLLVEAIKERLADVEGAFVGFLPRDGATGGRVRTSAFEEAEAGVLVIDRAGEEGLNLQFADLLIHYDLPLDPNRLEQRTGRLDRLGRTEPFDTRVLLGPEGEQILEISPYWAWYRMIRDAFGLFDTSVASLQFFFDDEMPGLRALLFEEGPPALLGTIDQYRERADQELRRIRQQDLLTAIDIRDEQGKRLWEDLQVAEAQVDTLQETVHYTLSKVWGLYSNHGNGWTSYTSSPRTLLPLDVQLDRFLPLYDRKVTKHRSLSVGSQGEIDLVRPGAAWVRRLASFQEWDDRGQAYALWRQVDAKGTFFEDDPWWAFVFDVLVEADAARVAAQMDRSWGPAYQAMLRRRGDALLKPQLIRVAVGPDGRVVSEQRLTKALLRPFDRETDTNLHKDRVEVLDMLVGHGWADRCRRARQAALDYVEESSAVQDAVRTARRRLSFRRRQATYQRTRREAHGLDSETERIDLLDSLEIGITAPRMRIDAAGFVVLSRMLLSEFVSRDPSLSDA